VGQPYFMQWLLTSGKLLAIFPGLMETEIRLA